MTVFRDLIARLDPAQVKLREEFAAIESELLSPEYVAELERRYPSVRATGVVSAAVVEMEIRRYEVLLADGESGCVW